ncbi:hypothetical protein [Parapedobacter sp. DT-150]|uniref:hypothetical protein n=1 Tax=Parapedobacter sp. DT-150 TaxID=3396162 RepID=UPI003F199F98
MNENEGNKELIHRIGETLRDHVEPYKDGAWEQFSTIYGPRTKRLLWPYWSAAAVIVLAIGLFWFNRQPAIQDAAQNKIAQQRDTTQQPAAAGETEATGEIATGEQVHESEAPVNRTILDGERLLADNRAAASVPAVDDEVLSTADTEVPIAEEIAVAAVSKPDTSTVAPTAGGAAPKLAVAAATETPARQSAVPLPADNIPGQRVPEDRRTSDYSTPVVADETENSVRSGTKKWNLGLVVSPSMTSEQVNLGGGLAVAYQLSDKFSVGSGVSIGRLGVGENSNYEPPYDGRQASPTENVQGLAKGAEEYRQDVSVTSNVVALDIPLDLRYEITKGFYTSVGVSYVAVLNEQRTEHFIGGLNQATFGNSSSLDKDLNASTQVVYSSARVADQPLQGKGYTGFMNFSIGRKMSLSRKLSISVEPYFKLPVGRLSREEMNFTNGGIRIVTGF